MVNFTAKGEASIFVDEMEIEARLFFEHNPNGEEWNVASLDALVRTRQLPALPAHVLEQFLENAASSKEPLDLLICRGQAPTKPIPEKVTWPESVIPAEIASIAKEVLAAAGPPAVYQTHINKIKKERLIKKPGLLAREEKETYWEEEAVQEKIDVDAQVLDTKYAEQGKIAGTIIAAKPGKSGKNIYGKLLNPEELDEDGILFGTGLEQRKTDIIALVTGILRIGGGWADVVPIPQPSWELDIGDDGASLFLSYTPGHIRYPRPRAKEILADTDPPDPSMLVDAAELDAALEQSTRSGEPITHYSLYRDRDAQALVEINSERSRALLRLKKGSRGRAPLDFSYISQVIRDSGIVVGKPDEVKKNIHEFLEGPEAVFLCTLAEGTPPTPEGDEEADILVPLLDEENAQSVLRRILQYPAFRELEKQGKIFPLSEPCSLAWVEKGGEVAGIGRGLPGKPGRSIEGELIPAPAGRELDIRLYQGLSRTETGISAAQGGLLMVKSGEGIFWAQVLDYRDGDVEVDVAEDGMEASVELKPSLGAGKGLSLETVMKALSEAGVSAGIDEAALRSALAELKRHSSLRCVAARGLPPVAPGGMTITWLLDMSDWERPPEVTKGTALADITEGGAAGKAGWDVGGRVKGAKTGEKESISWDESVSAKETPTGKRLFANRDGEIAFDGYTLQVSALRELEGDAGPELGTFTFAGELRIAGSVLPGAKISGGRGILVGGSVSGAVISSGGQVTVLRGIRGMGKTVIRARLAIDSPFAEQAALFSVSDIKIKDRASSCSIKTNGLILLYGENARLEGGVSKARLGLETYDLGNEEGAKTEVSFGQDYLIKDQLDQIQNEIAKLENTAGTSGAASRESATRIAELKARALALKAKFEEHNPAKITVRGAVWPGVILESHGAYYKITEPQSRVQFWYDRKTGKILQKGLE